MWDSRPWAFIRFRCERSQNGIVNWIAAKRKHSISVGARQQCSCESECFAAMAFDDENRLYHRFAALNTNSPAAATAAETQIKCTFAIDALNFSPNADEIGETIRWETSENEVRWRRGGRCIGRDRCCQTRCHSSWRCICTANSLKCIFFFYFFVATAQVARRPLCQKLFRFIHSNRKAIQNPSGTRLRHSFAKSFLVFKS